MKLKDKFEAAVLEVVTEKAKECGLDSVPTLQDLRSGRIGYGCWPFQVDGFITSEDEKTIISP